MRCIIVNGATLKAGVCCAHCHNKIGESYIREIGTQRFYCNLGCYGAVEVPVMAVVYRRGLLSSGGFNS